MSIFLRKSLRCNILSEIFPENVTKLVIIILCYVYFQRQDTLIYVSFCGLLLVFSSYRSFFIKKRRPFNFFKQFGLNYIIKRPITENESSYPLKLANVIFLDNIMLLLLTKCEFYRWFNLKKKKKKKNFKTKKISLESVKKLMTSSWCQSKLHKWKGILRFIVWHECFMQQMIRTKVIPQND